jgi:hypothetical protein
VSVTRRPLVAYLALLAVLLAFTGILVAIPLLQTRSLGVQTHDAVTSINAVLERLKKDEAQITAIAKRNTTKVEATTQRADTNAAQLAELRALIAELRLSTTTQISQISRGSPSPDVLAILAAILTHLDRIDARLDALDRQGAPSPTASPRPSPSPTSRYTRRPPGATPAPGSERCFAGPIFLCASATP